MLLTGFDAPVEQAPYLDRKMIAHELLQAIARVNRTCGRKRCGYVVDYIGVARHLLEALQDYDGEDTAGALIDIAVELPKLLGFINKVAANLYRDPALNLLGVAEKVKALIDAHISARGVDPKIPPTTHSPAFWNILDRAMPDWRERKEELRTQVQGLYWRHAKMA